MEQTRRKKKKRKGMAVLIISTIIIVLAAASCIFLYFYLNRPVTRPEDTVSKYFEYLSQGNYDGMYYLLDSQSQTNISREDFVTRNQAIYEGIGAENIEVTLQETESGDDQVRFQFNMNTSAGEMAFTNTAHLTYESGQWLIDWDDSLIFPELTSEDKVRVETISAERGSIYDRNGNLLAGQGTNYSVGIEPGKFSDTDMETLAELLEIETEEIENDLSASWVTDDTFVPIKEYTSDELSDDLREDLLAIDGVMINETESRVYPYGEATSHLIGYVQNVNAEDLEEHEGEGYTETSVIGRSGLESLYEDRLRGSDGCQIYIVDSSGKQKTMLAVDAVEDGEDITLTIDIDLQQALYETYKDDNSASVAMNPLTGEVLALVSTPTYNSNDFVVGMSQETWDALNNDENNPMYNRFRAALVPGSTFKPIIAAIGLTSGSFTADEDFGYSGLSWQPDDSWGSYRVTTLHTYSGDANVRNALVYSDNIYFAKAALRIGADTLMTSLDGLGFNETMPFDIVMTDSQYANADSGIDDEIQLADSGYGQGEVLVNPLHLASIYSAFLNNGSMIMPYLEYTEDIQPQMWKTNVFSSEAAETVKEDLVQVIEDASGTGHNAYTEGVTLAGKTGTAEIKDSSDDETGTELGWFVTFPTEADSSDSWMIVTMVEDVHDRGQSTYVVNKTKEIIDSTILGQNP